MSYTNVVDYARAQRETFEERGVCRVDSLVFSILAYAHIPSEVVQASTGEGIAVRELCAAPFLGTLCARMYDPQSSMELLTALAESPRFRDVRVSCFAHHTDERAEKQFAAMTLAISPREAYVAFRGTDNTLVGWKEDFNMSFQTAVPSQLEAVSYLNDVARVAPGRLWCGGHSKGGNLAVYASMMCNAEVQGRIERCFSHDGPGFSATTMADPRWNHALSVVDKTIPQSSVVGMVFERQEQDFTVVHSRGTGLSQHDPYRWEVSGCDFVYDKRLDVSATVLDWSVNSWLANATAEERERFVDAVFGVIAASGEDTMAGIKSNWRTSMPRMAVAASQLDPEDKELVMRAVVDVLRTMMPGRSKMEWLLQRLMPTATSAEQPDVTYEVPDSL